MRLAPPSLDTTSVLAMACARHAARSTTRLRRLKRSLIALGLGIGGASHAGGQKVPGWTFAISPYGWLAGVGGQVGVRDVTTQVDLSPLDVLHHLRFAAMGSIEGRRGPVVLALDGIYVSLRGSGVVALRGASAEITLDQKETIIHPTVGWAFNGNVWSVDALVGARYWNLNTTLDIDPARLNDRSRSAKRDWWDATGGLRVRIRPMSNLHFVVGGDGGGGGSQGSWAAIASASLDLSKRYNVEAAYRVLAVDYHHDNFLYDTHMNGWLVGVNFHF